MPVTALLLLLLAPSVPDFAAADSLPDADVRGILDALQEESGGRELLETLLWRRDQPYDLNQVTIAELLSIPAVRRTEADWVIRFRNTEGGFRSPDQLRRMPGGGSHAFRILRPYVTVGSRGSHTAPKRRVTFRSRFEEGRPYEAGAAGNPTQAYARLSLAPVEGIEMGGLFEKDAGERLHDAFRGGYLFARGLIPAVDLLIGDFSIEAGQGLVLWRGRGISKSGWSVTGPRKEALGITPHRSAEELRFFRGIVVSTHVSEDQNQWSGIAFISRRFLPAGAGDSGNLTSISESSAFTSAATAGRKDAIRVDATGGRILYVRGGLLSAGMTWVSSRYGFPLRPEDPYRFSGERFDAAGIDIRISHQPFFLFGETARGGRGIALVAGAGIDPDPRFSALVVFRNYSTSFDNLYSDGFSDNGDTRNEAGAYAGVALRPAPWLSIHAYYDQFRRPGPGTIVRFPFSGSEVMIDAHATINRHVSITGRITTKSTALSALSRDAGGREVREEGERTQFRWRMGAAVRMERGYEFKTRVEVTDVSLRPGKRERGILLADEFHARPLQFLQLTARLFFFATDSYESRLSTFEADLPGSFSSHPLYGCGRRWSVTFRLDLSGWGSISAVLDSVEKEPSVTTGSSNRETRPLRQSHAGVQLDLRF